VLCTHTLHNNTLYYITMAANVNHQQKGYVRRAAQKKKPHLVEPVKTAMIVKGQKTSQTIKDVLGDIAKLKAPSTVKYNKRNPVRPFEDSSSLEFFSDKSDSALFALGSHSAKRPDNLVLGRFFNHRMLDMAEFAVKNFKSMQSFKEPKHNLSSRTSVVFQGEEFENNADFKVMSNILLDFFVEQPTEFVNLACLDHVLIFTSQPGAILMRHYSIVLKKSGSRIPRIELVEIGPSMDLEIRRHRFATAELRSQSNTHHRAPKSKTKKNVAKDDLHQEMGTIHIGRQNLHELDQKRPKALRDRKQKASDDVANEHHQQQRKKLKKSEDE